MRLLCVEDEVSLREDIAEYLRMRSYEVDEAGTGEEAIQQMRRNHYDLILCDIKMPAMDGYELLRRVRNEDQLMTTPFLFLSALNERDDKIKAHEEGCDAYLTKPIDFSVLDATVRSHIERQQVREVLATSVTNASQRHMMTAIDDALTGPISEAGLIIQHLRDTVPVLTPTALDSHLATMQAKLNTHMIDLHTFYNTLQLQTFTTERAHESILAADLIRSATQECLYYHPSAPVRYKAMPPTGEIVHGDIRMLQRSLAGLLTTLPDAYDTKEIVRCEFVGQNCILTVADHPSMLDAPGYAAVDATTDLSTLSDVTRDRIVALTYAIQVAKAHSGKLELLLGADDRLAVRLTWPQSAHKSAAA